MRLVESILLSDMLRLAVHVERLGGRCLHSVCEFKAVDPRCEFVLCGRSRHLFAVERGEKIELLALAFLREVRGTFEIRNRLALRLQPRALIHAG